MCFVRVCLFPSAICLSVGGLIGKSLLPQVKNPLRPSPSSYKGPSSSLKKPVLQLDAETNEVVRRFGSLTEAAGAFYLSLAHSLSLSRALSLARSLTEAAGEFLCREWYW